MKTVRGALNDLINVCATVPPMEMQVASRKKREIPSQGIVDEFKKYTNLGNASCVGQKLGLLDSNMGNFQTQKFQKSIDLQNITFFLCFQMYP